MALSCGVFGSRIFFRIRSSTLTGFAGAADDSAGFGDAVCADTCFGDKVLITRMTASAVPMRPGAIILGMSIFLTCIPNYSLRYKL